MRLAILLIFFLATPVALAQNCTPTTFYVSPTGSDTAAGTEAAPWKTLSFAFTQLDPGETLKVRAGTYTGDFVYDRVGTSTAGITVENYPGESPVLEPSTREPLRVKSNASYTTFRGLTIQHAYPASNYQNVYVLNTANHILFERNTIRWALHGSGVFVDQTTDHIDFIGNRVYENNESGVQHQGIYHEGSNSIIARNVVYGHTNGFGIQVKTGADNLVIAQNTTADNSMSGILVMDTADHIRVENNISAFNGGYGVRALNDSDTSGGYGDCRNTPPGGCFNVVENNILYSNTSGGCVPATAGWLTCQSNLTSNPLFVDHTARNYHLQVGSPAIDTALNPWVYFPDADGITTLQPDISAYEFIP